MCYFIIPIKSWRRIQVQVNNGICILYYGLIRIWHFTAKYASHLQQSVFQLAIVTFFNLASLNICGGGESDFWRRGLTILAVKLAGAVGSDLGCRWSIMFNHLSYDFDSWTRIWRANFFANKLRGLGGFIHGYRQPTATRETIAYNDKFLSIK